MAITQIDKDVLCALAESMNATEAAEKANLTHPNLYYHIRKIKKETGLDARIPIQLFQLLRDYVV